MTRLFAVGENGLVEQQRTALDREDKIEKWVTNDLTLVGIDGIVIGRQVRTAHGKIIDILAIDGDGNLVIIELKRGKTPRDVVAQILDYASWVCHLTTKDVYDLARLHGEENFSKSFKSKFGSPPPDALNSSHQMIVVASEADDDTKRIIEYLSEQHDVGINASFFNIFLSGGRELLATDTLLDQTEVTERAVKKTRPPWSGYYYLTGGLEEDRPWEDMRKHGFFSAHGGVFYTGKLDKLKIGDPVFYYQKRNGYLGFGLISQERQHINDYKVETGELLKDVCDTYYLTEYIDDPEKACYVVGVDWKQTFPVNEAKFFSGIFANQNVVCGIYQTATVDFLEQEFGVEQYLNK